MFPLSRRNLLAGATLTLSSRVQGQSGRLKILVTGGHPGDPEYGCGGTIAKWGESGHDVSVLYLNRGEKGCSGKSAAECSTVRTAEAQEACRILRSKPRFAEFVDGEAIVSPATYSNFQQIVESEAPSVLLTHWPIDNHRDHRAISMLAYDAWRRIRTHCSLFYYEVSDGEDTTMFSPTEYVDISRTEALKRSACFAHASQSPERFYTLQSDVTRFRGIESGYRHAEGFIRHVESPLQGLPT